MHKINFKILVERATDIWFRFSNQNFKSLNPAIGKKKKMFKVMKINIDRLTVWWFGNLRYLKFLFGQSQDLKN